MNSLSHIVINGASPIYHSLCDADSVTFCDTRGMKEEKNGGPNHLEAWRRYNKMTQSELAEAVGTNQNMIGYLEEGERGLSAKWLRRLADALKTTPGMLLDHNPFELDADMIEIWVTGDLRQRQQLAEVAKALVRPGGKSQPVKKSA